MQARRFKLALYSFLILKLFYLTWHYTLYFGEHSIVYSQTVNLNGLKDLVYLVYASPSTFLPAVFMAIVFFCVGFALLRRKYSLVPDLIVWFCVLNLHNKIYPTLTGGDFILNQFLLINCFLTFRDSGQHNLATARKLFHNLAGIVLFIQIAFIYLVSGLAKLQDPEWMSGSALSAIAKVDHFSLHSAFRSDYWRPLFYFLTLFVVYYQLLFPLLMWWPRIKKPLLVTGVLMHMYIALVMGLLQFGLVMIVAYVFLWPAKSQNDSK